MELNQPGDGKISTLLTPLDRQIHKSDKLTDVCYDIRGPVLEEAHRLEEEGTEVLCAQCDAPRWHIRPDFSLALETGFSSKVAQDLAVRGHQILCHFTRPGYAQTSGRDD